MSTEHPIRLNGETYHVAAGATVADLIRQLDLPPDRVAVELDRLIVRRSEWATRRLEPHSTVEIVQIVGGG